MVYDYHANHRYFLSRKWTKLKRGHDSSGSILINGGFNGNSLWLLG
ncbi:hypothetical protein N9E30_02200 [Flavobacteriales bacterium]|jgi:hypothetical protein|nr:hypothetical protein [Flavobacteriales bacterium]